MGFTDEVDTYESGLETLRNWREAGTREVDSSHRWVLYHSPDGRFEASIEWQQLVEMYLIELRDLEHGKILARKLHPELETAVVEAGSYAANTEQYLSLSGL